MSNIHLIKKLNTVAKKKKKKHKLIRCCRTPKQLFFKRNCHLMVQMCQDIHNCQYMQISHKAQMKPLILKW